MAGVLVDEAAGLLFTSDRAAAQVCVYRCSDEQFLARVPVGPHPNGLAFDPSRRQLFSLNLGDPPGQGCTASVISLDRQQVIATIPQPGRPRWAVHDTATDQVFVSIRHPAQILAIGVPAADPPGCGWTAGGCSAPPTVAPL